MRFILTYFLIIIILILGCTNQIQANKDDLSTILNSENYEVIIKGCHGGMAGGVDCQDEFMFFNNDTLKYQLDDKIYIRLLDNSRKDSLLKYFYGLIDFHQPDKKIGKDGFGCLYHDYNYTFKNDSLELTIKPFEGNGTYYKIQELLNLDLFEDIISGLVYLEQVDSSELLLLKNQKITSIQKLVMIDDGKELIGGLHLKTTLNDTSFSLIPSPNPGLSLKRLSPILVFQDFRIFSDFVVLPERYIDYITVTDTLLYNIIGLNILGIEYVFKPNTEPIDKSLSDPYGIRFKDKYIMTILFENNKRIFVENKGVILDIYE